MIARSQTQLLGLLVVIGVAAVATVAAYDFTDSHYNEYVLRDMIEIAAADDDDQAVRAKRQSSTTAQADEDKKCGHKHSHKKHGFYKCCNDDSEESEAMHEQYHTLKRQCHTELRNGSSKVDDGPVDMFNCGKMNRTKDEYVCVTECVGKKMNILDNEGQLIESAFREHVRNEISRTAWQKAVADTVADKCITEVRAAANQTATATATATGRDATETTTSAAAAAEPKCNATALKLSHCLWREFTQACPVEMQSDSKKCVSLRDKLSRGVDVSEFHHSFHHHGGKFHHGPPPPKESSEESVE